MSIIAIIGPDGCGKTTQARLLVDRLNREGYKAIYVNPNYFLINSMFRTKLHNIFFSPRRNRTNSLKSSRNIIAKARSLLSALLCYLYALLSRGYMAFVAKHKIIVCDRYFYQFFYDLFGDLSNRVSNFFPRPDITFFLNTSLEILYSRMQSAFDKSVNKDYYIAVINLLKKLSQKYSFVEIEAGQNEKIISDIIFEKVKKYERIKSF